MDTITHVATGVLISQVLPGPSRGWAAVAGAIFAVLPDIDYFLVAWDRLTFIRHHRGFTHSFMAALLFTFLVAGVGRVLAGPRWFRPLFILGLAVLASHLLLDLATSYGTQLFSPFSRQKPALDWVFVIDLKMTGVLVVGALASLLSPGWGRQMALFCLAAAAVYLLLCGFYHHQALALAQGVFPKESQSKGKVAALPQPFSCRRWQLIASGPEGVRQTFVQLPYLPPPGFVGMIKNAQPAPHPLSHGFQAPEVHYQPPQDLLVQTWRTHQLPAVKFSPEAQRIIDIYQEFARFPLLSRVESQGQELFLEWLDLRFTVPGRAFPFVLQLCLDLGGRLHKWQLVHCGAGKLTLYQFKCPAACKHECWVTAREGNAER